MAKIYLYPVKIVFKRMRCIYMYKTYIRYSKIKIVKVYNMCTYGNVEYIGLRFLISLVNES